ncbi:hypothetical protein MMYC01_207684 [Madurella mycetomatis]|uniref:Uncharacterized protein n=1 Tax=Madurella mycetomatis TaxID=100816 RepID=A0A175W0E9_9PEZI|nr:hypothetical protein MMYC01_207684 [Madurella mycetomatis]
MIALTTLSPDNAGNIGGGALNWTVEDGIVAYSYATKEYKDSKELPSTDTVLYSSANCTLREVFNNKVYEKGKIVGTLYLYSVNDISGDGQLPVCYGIFYECLTCLRDQDGRAGPETILFDQYQPLDAFYGATQLLRFGAVGQIRMYDIFELGDIAPSQRRLIDIRAYVSSPYNIQFVDPLRLADVLRAAHVAARLPILTVIGAEMRLPRVAKVAGATESSIIMVALEVKWDRVAGVLGAILVGQVIAIAATINHCRKFILHDYDSFLPIARLLKTAMEHAQGRSVDPAVKIAAQIKNGKGVARTEERRIRYGTRNRNGIYEVDLWDDVENNFPEARYR